MTRRVLCSMLLVAALAVAACGGDDDAGATKTQTVTDRANDPRLAKAKAAARANPEDPFVWAGLTREHFRAAGGSGYDEARQVYTAAGLAQLRLADAAWRRHLALAQDRPDATMAGVMVQAYSRGGLRDLAGALRAQQIVVDGRQDRPPAERAENYSLLAVLAYQAKDIRRADLAAQRAVELTPAANRETVRAQLRTFKEQTQD